MKKHIILISIVIATLSVFFTGCKESDYTYSGPEYVMFADTLTTFPVTVNADKIYEIVVGSTVALPYDRTYAVEIYEDKNTAIEGVNYSLVSPNFTIPAGEMTGIVQVKVDYESLEANKTLDFKLRLRVPNAVKWDIYSDITRVELVKSCPFSIDDFVRDGGNYVLTYTFPETAQRLVTAVKVDETRIDFSSLGGDELVTRLIFNYDEDALRQTVTILPQRGYYDPYNYGWINYETTDIYPSYFHTCDTFIELMILASMDGGYFGVFPFYLNWVSAEEAEDLRRQGMQ